MGPNKIVSTTLTGGVIVYLLLAQPSLAGTPHIAYGTLQYSDETHPVSITFTACIKTRTGEVLTQSSAGCGYDTGSGQWYVQCGNFPTAWVAGEVLHVEFNDGAGGTGAAEVPLTDDPEDDAGTTTLTLSNTPDIAVSPTSEDFGEIAVGASSTQTFVITNNGEANLEVSATNLVGSDAAEFTIVNGGGAFTLSLGEDRNIDVRFTPTSHGTKSAALRLTSNDPDENPKDVPLTGIGIAPDIVVYPVMHDFGDVSVGSSKTRNFYVRNHGNADLSVTSTEIVGSDPHDFTIESGGGSFTVSPSAGHEIYIRFSPSSLGQKQAKLHIQSNDPDENPKETLLTGNGAAEDTSPPYLTGCYPPAGASSVPKNTTIQLQVRDNGLGIDRTTFGISLNGTTIVSAGEDQTAGCVSIASHDKGCSVFYTPASDFQEESLVTLQIRCQDLATSTNALDSTYSFTVGSSTVIQTHGDTVDHTGGLVTDNLTDIQITIPDGALHETAYITIGIINYPPALPDSVRGIGLAYHFGPDGLQFADFATVRIPYTQADLSNAGVSDPTNLPVYYFSTVPGEWTRLPIIDADESYIYVEVEEFCYLIYGKESTTGTKSEESSTPHPAEFVLMQNYPNPFNPETTIPYTIPKPGDVSLIIYNTKGQAVRTLVAHVQSPGSYETIWDGKNDNGKTVPSGMYFYVLRLGKAVRSKKAIFIK